MKFTKEVVVTKITNLKDEGDKLIVTFDTEEDGSEECPFLFKTPSLKARFFRLISDERKTGVVFSLIYDTKEDLMWINEVRNFEKVSTEENGGCLTEDARTSTMMEYLKGVLSDVFD